MQTKLGGQLSRSQVSVQRLIWRDQLNAHVATFAYLVAYSVGSMVQNGPDKGRANFVLDGVEDDGRELLAKLALEADGGA